jgi:hypothetical protein
MKKTLVAAALLAAATHVAAPAHATGEWWDTPDQGQHGPGRWPRLGGEQRNRQHERHHRRCPHGRQPDQEILPAIRPLSRQSLG